MTALQPTADTAAPPKYRRYGLTSWVLYIGLAVGWYGLFYCSNVLTQRYFSNIYIQPAHGIAIGFLFIYTVIPLVNGAKRWTGLGVLAVLGAGVAGIAAWVNRLGSEQVGAFYLTVAFYAALIGAFFMVIIAAVMRLVKSLLTPGEPKVSLGERWRRAQGTFVLILTVLSVTLASVATMTLRSPHAPAVTGVAAPYWPYGLCLAWGVLFSALVVIWGLIRVQPAAK